MIYTVTFNPSLDYTIVVDDFKIGKTNRTKEEYMVPGGKGINVSVVLKNLGYDSVALGFTAGFTGEEISAKLKEIGCNIDFIKVQNGISRINVKIKNIEGTEINGAGPSLEKEHINKLLNKLDSLKDGDVLVLAGSIPPSVDQGIYSQIMDMLKNRNVLMVVDATEKLLLSALKYKPFLIKPNIHELGEIFGIEINDKANAIKYAYKLQEMGGRNVLVSMAGEGAVLVDEAGNIHKTSAPKGEFVNGVGAGDSMVAGFIAGWLEKQDYEHAFYMGVSTGSATAFSDGLAKKEDVIKIYKDLNGK